MTEGRLIGRHRLFGGPAKLLVTAQTLAEDPHQPDRLLVNRWDYQAAGLDRNGPTTYVAAVPSPSLTRAGTPVPSVSFRRCEVMATGHVPPGEIWALKFQPPAGSGDKAGG